MYGEHKIVTPSSVCGGWENFYNIVATHDVPFRANNLFFLLILKNFTSHPISVFPWKFPTKCLILFLLEYLTSTHYHKIFIFLRFICFRAGSISSSKSTSGMTLIYSSVIYRIIYLLNFTFSVVLDDFCFYQFFLSSANLANTF